MIPNIPKTCNGMLVRALGTWGGTKILAPKLSNITFQVYNYLPSLHEREREREGEN